MAGVVSVVEAGPGGTGGTLDVNWRAVGSQGGVQPIPGITWQNGERATPELW